MIEPLVPDLNKVRALLLVELARQIATNIGIGTPPNATEVRNLAVAYGILTDKQVMVAGLDRST